MTEAEKYVEVFQEAANQLDQKRFEKMQIEVAVVEVLNSVVLKLYKKSWVNPDEKDPLTAKSRIFCSIWVSDNSIARGQIFYNIHAFKLRQLRGYSIESRKFAALFRENFKPFEQQWPNVSVEFGPLTLMEGWSTIDVGHFRHDIVELANNFLKIIPLVDHALSTFKL
jgi:hypothetical protein